MQVYFEMTLAVMIFFLISTIYLFIKKEKTLDRLEETKNEAIRYRDLYNEYFGKYENMMRQAEKTKLAYSDLETQNAKLKNKTPSQEVLEMLTEINGTGTLIHISRVDQSHIYYHKGQ